MAVNSVNLSGAGAIPSNDPKKELPEKSRFKEYFDTAIEYITEGYKDACQALKLSKAVKSVVDEFVELPRVVSEIFYWTKPVKVIKGVKSASKLYKSTVKLIKADTWSERGTAAWKMVRAFNGVLGAVEAVGNYLVDFSVIPEIAMVWTKYTSIIFMPIGFVNTGIAINKLYNKVSLMQTLNKETKVSKSIEDRQERLDAMKRAITHVQKTSKEIKKAGVVDKARTLDERMAKIFAKLNSAEIQEQNEAFDEGKMCIKKLKGRIRAHVVSDAINTSLSVAGCAMTVFGMICPALTLPAAIVDLGLAVAGTANYVHAKFIPRGELRADEIESPYTKAYKGVKYIKKEISQGFQNLFGSISARAA